MITCLPFMNRAAISVLGPSVGTAETAPSGALLGNVYRATQGRSNYCDPQTRLLLARPLPRVALYETVSVFVWLTGIIPTQHCKSKPPGYPLPRRVRDSRCEVAFGGTSDTVLVHVSPYFRFTYIYI